MLGSCRESDHGSWLPRMNKLALLGGKLDEKLERLLQGDTDVGNLGAPGMDPADSAVFVEEPVPLDVFVQDALYLKGPRLSEEQFMTVALVEAVYFNATFTVLDWWYLKEPWWNPSYTELAVEWGKGSGKDHIARVAVARVAYLLECLEEPHLYYNFDPDSSIDILNVARSTKQANDVFFEPLRRTIGRSPWFSDKHDFKMGKIILDKNIIMHSGHADQESLEGFNLMLGVADEIASFKTKEETRTRQSPRPIQHSADAIADMMRTSGQSRFPGLAKVLYISYPRFAGDFIEQKVAQALNEPTMYGTKKATWEVNPTKTREMFREEYAKDPEGSAAKYECKPPAALNKYFRNDAAIDRAFAILAKPPVDDLGFLVPDFMFLHRKKCAVHLDMALTNDRGGLAICHMQDWHVRTTQDGHELRQPIIFPDVITSFSAAELGVPELDLSMFEDFVIECIRRGANIQLVTADQFQSRGSLQNLRRQGIECRLRSVDRDTSAYDMLKAAIYQGRFIGYNRERVVTELKGLQLVNGVKVDHVSTGSKDEADALAGATAGVIEMAYIDLENEVEFDHIGWAEPDSTWHDPMRGSGGPWGNTYSHRAQASPGTYPGGAMR